MGYSKVATKAYCWDGNYGGFNYANNQYIDRIEIRAAGGMAKEKERDAFIAETALRLQNDYS